jgi:hypothetical protein
MRMQKQMEAVYIEESVHIAKVHSVRRGAPKIALAIPGRSFRFPLVG